jgi:hypothetical protein
LDLHFSEGQGLLPDIKLLRPWLKPARQNPYSYVSSQFAYNAPEISKLAVFPTHPSIWVMPKPWRVTIRLNPWLLFSGINGKTLENLPKRPLLKPVLNYSSKSKTRTIQKPSKLFF